MANRFARPSRTQKVRDIGENQTYPYLRVYLTGDINHDRIVNLLDFAIIAEEWMNEE